MIRDPSQVRPTAALPLAGDGTDGEFVGTCARQLELGGSISSSLMEAGAVFLATGFSGPELVDGGGDISVTGSNVVEFVELAKSFFLHSGIDPQLATIRAGIHQVLPVDALLLLSPEELRAAVCGEDEIEWDEETLETILNFHDLPLGMNEWLVEALLEMSNSQRSTFLDFVTSCPRLPPNLKIEVFPETFASSNLTSPVLRPASPPMGPAAPEVVGYPRSRACVNHLYLPRYKSRETLRERLLEAMVSSVHHDEITG